LRKELFATPNESITTIYLVFTDLNEGLSISSGDEMRGSPLTPGVTSSIGLLTYPGDLEFSATSVKEPAWMLAMPHGRGPRW